jgi:hypothetical protein
MPTYKKYLVINKFSDSDINLLEASDDMFARQQQAAQILAAI